MDATAQPVSMPPAPTVGRIVMFVMRRGEIRPAIVVSIWGPMESGGCVNLQVFTDGANDDPQYIEGRRVAWMTSVLYSGAKTPHSWHWPERA